MKNHYTLELFKDFSDDEIIDFEKFLNSPYHVNFKSLSKIFDEIIRNRNLIVKEEYDLLFEMLINKFRFNKTTLNKRFSYLGNAVFDYLKVKSCFSDSISSDVILNDYLQNNKLFTILRKNIDKISSNLNDSSIMDEKTYINSFFKNTSIFTFLLQDTKLSSKRGIKSRLKYLDDAVNDISLFLLTQLSSIYINYISLTFNKANNKKYLFPESLKNLFNNYDKFYSLNNSRIKNSVVNIYKAMFLAYQYRGNKKYYFEYKFNVENCYKYLSKILVNFHYKVLINYCIIQDRLGEEKDFYKKEKTDLLFKYFSNDIYKIYNDEFITCVEYTNFVGTAYSAGEFDTLKLFIENNSSKLNPLESKDMLNYGYAYYYLGIKNYSKARRCINDIKFYYCYYKHNIKNIELRISYETNKLEILRDSIHNYRTEILKDNLLTKSDKNSLLKLLKYLNILILIRNYRDFDKRVFEANYYKGTLEKETTFALKKWLLEKFDEITSGSKSIRKVKT